MLIRILIDTKKQMLFTWDTTNLCIVFRQWHIRSTTSLVFSLIAVVLLAMGYEGLRSLSQKYEQAVAKRINALPRKLCLINLPVICFVFHLSSSIIDETS